MRRITATTTDDHNNMNASSSPLSAAAAATAIAMRMVITLTIMSTTMSAASASRTPIPLTSTSAFATTTTTSSKLWRRPDQNRRTRGSTFFSPLCAGPGIANDAADVIVDAAVAAQQTLMPETTTTAEITGGQQLSPEVTVTVFVAGLVPFLVATYEFWRRIAFGESFGTGNDSVVIPKPTSSTTTIGEDNNPTSSRGRRVLGKDALYAAYVLFAVSAAVLAITIYSVVSTSFTPSALPPAM